MSGIYSKRNKLSGSENFERNLPGRCTITITISNSDDDNYILRKCTVGYKVHKSQEKINCLMYIDGINFFAENEKELETLIQVVTIYSNYMGKEFSIEKCAVRIMESGKSQITEGIELPNQEKLRTFSEKETYKYLEILEVK